MRIAQSDTYQGNDWWEWAVWIDGTPDELNSIDAVTYTLHPSFRHPVRRLTNRDEKFRMEEAGWGIFTLFAEVHLAGDTIRKLEHELQLHYPDTERKAPALIRFASLTSATSEHAVSLKGAILDAAPDAEVTMVKMPPAEGMGGPITSGEALSIDLTGPAVAALARGIQSWLLRNDGVELELVTEDGKTVKLITSENIVPTLQLAMTSLRNL